MASKHDRFEKVFSGDKIQYKCSLCSRQLSSKQNILIHLHKLHSLSPVKRQKKLYLTDKDLDVPPRTLYRWKNKTKQTNTLSCEQDQLPSKTSTKFASHGAESLECDVEISSQATSDVEISSQATSDVEISSQATSYVEISSQATSDRDINNDSVFNNSSGCTSELSDVGSSYSGYMSDTFHSHTEEESSDINTVSDSNSDTDVSSDTESEYSSCSDTEYSSCSDTEYSSCSGTANADSGDQNYLMTNELEALTIVSTFRRHNLTTSACKDILDAVKSVCKDSKNAHVLNYDYLLSFVDSNQLNEVHYCELCNEVFPKDLNIFRCSTTNCEGLRYKGPRSKQNSKERQPRQCFIVADVEKQLTDFLQSPDVMANIRSQKTAARSQMNQDTITDIIDGTAYRKMLNGDGFLNNADYNITAVINTDGVNLYSSSKVELWPIFMAINELNPRIRFSRNNVLLVAIWQGKGKPPFKQYIECLAPHMNSLYREGINMVLNGNKINVKVKVVCGVFDLPAKAGILNMNYYNGTNACITCEEPGLTVPQGNGSARSYPYRNGQHTLRKHEDVLDCMHSATHKKKIKGFKGVSGLISIESFDLVDGIVPDYMHAVLLGVTNTLMCKWFSPTESRKDYFVGKHLNEISLRLQNIQPPTSIERLPRDLEKHYRNLKATELQAWLLFYAVPCLVGILPEVYLAHFTCLSEAVYILLGDQITPASLQRAQRLLDQFYSSFADLYGAGSCGLNVHNTCVHLVHFVKMWGPLWAWSCFGFEDNNAMLLQAVHGTGVVTKQIMGHKQVEATLRRKSLHEGKQRYWKTTYKAENCDVAGKMTAIGNAGIEDFLVELGIDSDKNVKQISRVIVNGRNFCSLKYTRMKKRVCSYVLYSDGKVGCVKYFVIVTDSNIVYAVLEKYDSCEEVQFSQLPAAKHLVPIKATGIEIVIPANDLIDTLVYINVCPELCACVALMPSTHGHAIFK